jgi:hypothetical protein
LEDFREPLDNLIEGNGVEAVLTDDLLRTQVSPQEDFEQHDGVVVCFSHD